MAAVKEAALISSRSCSSGLETMMRCRELADLFEPDGGGVQRRTDHAKSRGAGRGGLDGGYHPLL